MPEDAVRQPVPTTSIVGHPPAFVNIGTGGKDFCMARKPNTNCQGGSFSESERSAVWRKGLVVVGFDPNVLRRESCGARIEWSQYGLTIPGGRGWEIDHKHPVAQGGSDSLVNLQPLQWENNRHKSDNWPHWTCKVNAA